MNSRTTQGGPRIVVVIPACNAAATLDATLSSVVRQTYTSWSAVIVNDGSTDETQAVARKWAARDARFKTIDQANAGAGAARNAGLRIAQGDLLHCLDADDLVSPGFYAAAVSALQEDGSTDMRCAYAGFCLLGKKGNVFASFDACPPERFSFSRLVRDNNVGPPGILVFDRKLLETTGLFDEDLPNCQDWDLWLRFARVGTRFVRVPEACLSYRVDAFSLSRRYASFMECGQRVLERATRPDARCADAAHLEPPVDERTYLVGLARFWHNTLLRAAGAADWNAVKQLWAWGETHLPDAFWEAPRRFNVEPRFRWIESGPGGTASRATTQTLDRRLDYLWCLAQARKAPLPRTFLAGELGKLGRALVLGYPWRPAGDKMRVLKRWCTLCATLRSTGER